MALNSILVRLSAISFACALFLSVSIGVGAQEGTANRKNPALEKVQFIGNTVFSDAELNEAAAPFIGREAGPVLLDEVRRAVTIIYVNAGFINSGALFESWEPAEGVLTLQIVEGRLTEVEIEGNRWLRTGYLRARIRPSNDEPLNTNDVVRSLSLLRQNPNIRALKADLRPGLKPGESRLKLAVQENSPFEVGVQARNDRPPSVGADVLEILAAHNSLTRNADRLDLRYGVLQRRNNGARFSGADNLGVSYQLPVTRHDTRLGASYSRGDFAILEEPFNALDIRSESEAWSASLDQPIWRNADSEFRTGVSFDWRRSQSFLLGAPFSFSPGFENGEAVVSALRWFSHYERRGIYYALAARSTFSFGLPVLDAVHRSREPDADFVAWTGQAQYARRLGNTLNQLILRGTVQWANDPLLSLEQLSIGGAQTVRGYRENTLVRDIGGYASLEFRFPVLLNRLGAPVLQVAPFFDFGGGVDYELRGIQSRSSGPDQIYSTGLGLVADLTRRFHGEIFWGYRLRRVNRPANDDDLQDHGVHFRLGFKLF